MERKRIDHSLRIAVTGHRKWKNPKLVKQRLYKSLDTMRYAFKIIGGIEKKKLIFLHGCALGIDMWFGEYALKHDIGLELYLPFEIGTQIKKGRFQNHQIRSLERQVIRADKTVVVNDTFSTYGYQRRNMVMVNNSNMLVPYYTRSRSGSGNCERYAIQEKKKIIDLRKLWKIFDITDPRQLSNALL